MIRQKTVFIIGAGASQPYGYPTGRELREKIIQGGWLQKVDISNGIPRIFIKKFNLSNNESIDLFLSRNKAQQGFTDLGKFVVFDTIYQAESDSLSSPKPKNWDEIDWCSFLFNKMIEGIDQLDELDRFKENMCTFIIFNYDRSFEHNFFQSLTNTFSSIPSKRILELFQTQKIFHVYGKIAPLQWEDNNGLVYGQECDSISRANFRQDLLLIGEERQNIDTVTKQGILQEAERIIFLGFGFAQDNLQLLGFPQVLQDSCDVFGSGVGLYQEEIDRFKYLIKANPNSVGKFMIEPGATCKDVLRKYL